ncbi:AEC family transporter [Aureimonas ureilytica]|uniref:AEC family transporter n=1 Tax=Aureimonas ureilytica TaxID=401562 RepID=UPI00037E2843|nr:AEC family transporter [Aureimonas ureilytica]
MIQTLVSVLTPVFFMLGLGFVSGKRHWVNPHGTDMLGAFIAKFALPVSLFLAIVTAPRHLLAPELVPTVAYAAALLSGFAIALYTASRAGFSPVTAALYSLTAGMPNLGGIGLALFQSLEGSEAAVSLAVANLVGTLTVILACFVRLEMQGGGHPLRAVSAALLKPMTIVPTLGFVVAFLDLPFPDLFVSALRPLAQSTAGAGLFLTGVILSTQRLRPTRPVMLGALASNIVQPAVALIACLALHLPAHLEARAIIAMAIPAGFVGTILSAVYREGAEEAGGVLVASSALSIVTLPLWIVLALWIGGA